MSDKPLFERLYGSEPETPASSQTPTNEPRSLSDRLYGTTSQEPATDSRATANLTGAPLQAPAATTQPAEPAAPEPRPLSERLFGEEGDQGFEIAGVRPSLTEEALMPTASIDFSRFGQDAMELIQTSDHDQVSQAFVAAGFGPSMSDAVMAAAAEAYQVNNGEPLTDGQITSRKSAVLAELKAVWGNQYDRRFANANAMYQKAIQGRPELAETAHRLGLTTDPSFIRLLEARSRRAKG